MPDWWDQQGVPVGGAVAPIEDDYTPYPTRGGTGTIADAQARYDDPNRINHYGPAGPGAGGARMPGVSLNGLTNDGRGLPGGRPGTPGAGGTGGGAAYSDQALQDILHKYPATNDGMRAAMQEIDRTFGPGTVKLLDHPERLDKLVLPDGRTIDTIKGAGAPGADWTWIVEGAGGHGGAGGYAPGSFGSLVGSPMAGSGLTPLDAFNFRMSEGTKAIERSAAAKGTLLTGKTLKDMARFGQGLASTEYGAEWDRNFNQDNAVFNRLYQTAGLGANAAGNAGQLASGYAGAAGNLLLGQGQTQANSTAGQANTWGQTIGTLANLYGQYAAGRGGGDPNNTGNYLDVGRGLY